MNKFTDHAHACDFVFNNLQAIKILYIQQDYTARETAEYFGYEFCQHFQRALSRYFHKADHGGARKGAGMKKGTALCGRCRRKKGNCECEW